MNTKSVLCFKFKFTCNRPQKFSVISVLGYSDEPDELGNVIVRKLSMKGDDNGILNGRFEIYAIDYDFLLWLHKSFKIIGVNDLGCCDVSTIRNKASLPPDVTPDEWKRLGTEQQEAWLTTKD